MKLTKEEFRKLSNEDKLLCIQNLHSYYDRELIFKQNQGILLKKQRMQVKLIDDEEIVRWCLELVAFSDFEEIPVKRKEKYPILTEKYFECVN